MINANIEINIFPESEDRVVLDLIVSGVFSSDSKKPIQWFKKTGKLADNGTHYLPWNWCPITKLEIFEVGNLSTALIAKKVEPIPSEFAHQTGVDDVDNVKKHYLSSLEDLIPETDRKSFPNAFQTFNTDAMVLDGEKEQKYQQGRFMSRISTYSTSMAPFNNCLNMAHFLVLDDEKDIKKIRNKKKIIAVPVFEDCNETKNCDINSDGCRIYWGGHDDPEPDGELFKINYGGQLLVRTYATKFPSCDPKDHKTSRITLVPKVLFKKQGQTKSGGIKFKDKEIKEEFCGLSVPSIKVFESKNDLAFIEEHVNKKSSVHLPPQSEYQLGALLGEIAEDFDNDLDLFSIEKEWRQRVLVPFDYYPVLLDLFKPFTNLNQLLLQFASESDFIERLMKEEALSLQAKKKVNTKKTKATKKTKSLTIIATLEEWFWATTRDLVGFGLRKNHRKFSIFQQAMERFLDQFEDNTTIRDRYEKQIFDLLDVLKKNEDFSDVSEWRTFLMGREDETVDIREFLNAASATELKDAIHELDESFEILKQSVDDGPEDIEIEGSLAEQLTAVVSKAEFVSSQINSSATASAIIRGQWFRILKGLLDKKKSQLDKKKKGRLDKKKEKELKEYLGFVEAMQNFLRKSDSDLDSPILERDSVSEEIAESIFAKGGISRWADLNAGDVAIEFRNISSNFLGGFIEKRFENSPPRVDHWADWPFYPDVTPNSSFVEELKVFVAKKIADCKFPSREVFDSPRPLQIAVDAVGHNDSTELIEDWQERLAGAVVFGRRKSEKKKGVPWICFNVAKATLTSPKDGKLEKLKQDKVNRTMLIPTPMIEIDGVRKATVEISNENPTTVADREIDFSDDDDAPEINIATRVQLSLPLEEKNGEIVESAKCLWLEYGNTYEFCAGYITNSGLLPVPVRNSTTEFNIPKFGRRFTFEFNKSLGVEDYRYLRRVPVSSVRIAPITKGTKYEDIFWAPMSDVYPLSHDMPEWKDDKFDWQGKTIEEDERALKQVPKQLLLLHKGQQGLGRERAEGGDFKAEFRVLKPATSFWNWFAWKEHEQSVVESLLDEELKYRRSIQNSAYNSQDGAVRESKPIAPDPAVADTYMIEYQQLFPKKDDQWKRLFLDWDVKKDGRKSGATFKVRSSKNVKTISISGSAGKVLIEIPQAEIARVRISPLCDRSLFDLKGSSKAKFHRAITDLDTHEEVKVVDKKTTKQYLAFAPTEIWIESTYDLDSGWNPSTLEPHLWHSLNISDVGKDTDSIIQVAVEVSRNPVEPEESLPGCFRELAKFGEIEVWHQIWNWDGRNSSQLMLDGHSNVFEFPFAKSNEERIPESESDDELSIVNETETSKWDGLGFGNRPDLYHQQSESRLVGRRLPRDLADVELPSFDGLIKETKDDKEVRKIEKVRRESVKELKNSVEQTVYSENRSNDRRGLYYRFAVRGYSRYRGLPAYAVLKPIDGKVAFDEITENNKGVAKTRWKPFYRPCRLIEKLPKPSIRFAIPLTGDLFSNKNTSSVMLVLDEPWHAEAGLPEVLEARIETIKTPDESEIYLNAGFDPTLSNLALDAVDPGKIPSLWPHKNISGPFGFTFDFAAATPKLIGAGFMLEIPEDLLGESAKPSSPYFMIQASFRRNIRILQGATKEQSLLSGQSFVSDWSAPMWIQFLPNSHLLLPASWSECPNGEVELPFSKANKVEIEFGKFEDTLEDRFYRFIILTELKTDVRGELVETYLCTLMPGKEKDVFEPAIRHTGFTPSGQTGYARVVLARRRKDDNSIVSDPWEEIFGKTSDIEESIREDAKLACPIVSPRQKIVVKRST
jgi:hypothetical protein